MVAASDARIARARREGPSFRPGGGPGRHGRAATPLATV